MSFCTSKRVGWFALGVAVLGCYGLFVNLPQWDFGRLLGVYVALFFVVAQVVAKVRFHQSPTVPIRVGGVDCGGWGGDYVLEA